MDDMVKIKLDDEWYDKMQDEYDDINSYSPVFVELNNGLQLSGWLINGKVLSINKEVKLKEIKNIEII